MTQRNQFAPPEAVLADPPPRAGSPVKAVLAGLAVDLGGSLLLGIVLGIVYGISLARSGLNGEQIRRAAETMPPDSWLVIVGTIAGAALSVLGGFVCARIARRSDYLLGFVLGGISAAVTWATALGSHGLLASLALAALGLACVLLGTHLGRVAR